MYSDLVHVIPTDAVCNNNRNDLCYGEIADPAQVDWQSADGFSKKVSRADALLQDGKSRWKTMPRNAYTSLMTSIRGTWHASISIWLPATNLTISHRCLSATMITGKQESSFISRATPAVLGIAKCSMLAMTPISPLLLGLLIC